MGVQEKVGKTRRTIVVRKPLAPGNHVLSGASPLWKLVLIAKNRRAGLPRRRVNGMSVGLADKRKAVGIPQRAVTKRRYAADTGTNLPGSGTCGYQHIFNKFP